MKLKTKKDAHASLGMDDTKEFSIDTESHMIVQILRDKIYSNKVAAVCREVSSNCRDANREAGRPDVPVLISIHDDSDLIGDGSTLISFKDSGIGISPDRIENVFLKYGSSTKRSSNNQTGGFGIGAKTPFAYTNNFLITTVANVDGKNMKYIYQAAIVADGHKESSQLILISDEETNEPTGTIITVPIGSTESDFNLRERIQEFEWESKHATAMWEVKPIFDGFKYETEGRNKIEVVMEGEGWKIVKDSDDILNCSYNLCASVDGIPYVIDSDKIKDSGRNSKLETIFGRWDDLMVVLKVETGSVTLSASREDVEYIPENLDVFIEIYDKMKVELKNRAKKLYKSEKTQIGKGEIINMIINGTNREGELGDSCRTYRSALGKMKDTFLTKEERAKVPLRYKNLAVSNHKFILVNVDYATNQTVITSRDISKADLQKYPVFYRDVNSCKRRNMTISETILKDGNEHMLIIMPSKIGTTYLTDTDSIASINTFLGEIGVTMTKYSDVEKKKLPKSTKVKVQKDSIGVPAREYNGNYSIDKITIECERGKNKKPTGKIVEGVIDPKKSFLLTVDTVSRITNGSHRMQEAFSTTISHLATYEVPDFLSDETYNKISTVSRLLRNYGGYRLFVVSDAKKHYFAKEKFLTAKDINKTLEKIISEKRFKDAVQDVLNYNATEEIEINEYMDEVYEKNPNFLMLGGVDVKDIESAKKCIEYELKDFSNEVYNMFNHNTIFKLSEKFELKAKDFGVKVTSGDIDRAFSKVRTKYPIIHYLFKQLENDYSWDYDEYGTNREQGYKNLLKAANEMVKAEIDKLPKKEEK